MKQEEIFMLFSGIGIGIYVAYVTLYSIKKCYKKQVSFSQVKEIKYIPTKEEEQHNILPTYRECIYCKGEPHLIG